MIGRKWFMKKYEELVSFFNQSKAEKFTNEWTAIQEDILLLEENRLGLPSFFKDMIEHNKFNHQLLQHLYIIFIHWNELHDYFNMMEEKIKVMDAHLKKREYVEYQSTHKIIINLYRKIISHIENILSKLRSIMYLNENFKNLFNAKLSQIEIDPKNSEIKIIVDLRNFSIHKDGKQQTNKEFEDGDWQIVNGQLLTTKHIKSNKCIGVDYDIMKRAINKFTIQHLKISEYLTSYRQEQINNYKRKDDL